MFSWSSFGFADYANIKVHNTYIGFIIRIKNAQAGVHMFIVPVLVQAERLQLHSAFRMVQEQNKYVKQQNTSTEQNSTMHMMQFDNVAHAH